MIAALIVLAAAAAALAGAVAVLSVRLATIAGRAINASDARGRADVANTATAADLRTARSELEAARRDLDTQKDVTRALSSLAASQRGSALDAPGVDPIDVLLALAKADGSDVTADNPAVRAGDATVADGGEDRLPRPGWPAPLTDEFTRHPALP